MCGGVKIKIESDLPAGSGMGSSASVATALIGGLGEFFGGWFIRQKLKKMFEYRHQLVTEECEVLATAKSDT